MIELDKLYLGDCLDILNDVQENSVDCIICDLPYGTTECAWDSTIPLEPLWRHYKRVLKHQGSVLLFGSEPFSTMLRMANLDWYKYDWIWRKNMPTGHFHAKNMPIKDYEIISVFSAAKMGHESLLKEDRMIYNPQGLQSCHVVENGKRKANGIYKSRPSHKDVIIREQCNYPRMVIDFQNQNKELKNDTRIHPTQKPVDLLRYLILTYTNKGGVVLDNCMGSGSTAIAAIKEERHFIGIELNKEYFEKANKRIHLQLQQPTLWNLNDL